MARRRSRRAESSPNYRLPLAIAEYAVPGLSPLFSGVSSLAHALSYVAPDFFGEGVRGRAPVSANQRVVTTAYPRRVVPPPAKPKFGTQAYRVFEANRLEAKLPFMSEASREVAEARVCLLRGQRKEVLFAKRIAGRSGRSPGPYRARSTVKC